MNPRIPAEQKTIVVHDRPSVAGPPASVLHEHVLVDVDAVARRHANALIIGDQFAVRRVLDTVWPSLAKPVQWVDGTRLALPVVESGGGTLVLDAGDRLSERDQASFLGWLNDNGRSVRVLTTSPRPLFPLVEAGLFFDVLYYRLNQVCIDAGSLPG
jgi:hypothetical protein